MSSTIMKLSSIFPVTCHTDYVGQGSTFVAIKGFKHDGLSYIPLAIDRGATKIILEEGTVLSSSLNKRILELGIEMQYVENTRHALAILSAQAAGYPTDHLTIVGITGTKGKSTTSFILEHMLASQGYTTALLTTVYNKINGTIFPSPLTTAQPDYLHQFFKTCLEHGVTHVVMEVAAQALSLHRVAGIFFDAVIFTNFSSEHSEFYFSMEGYFQDKSSILEHTKPNAFVVINGDDLWCRKLLEQYPRLHTFSLTTKGDYRASVTQESPELHIHLNCEGQEFDVHAPLLMGQFNAANAIAATAVARSLGVTQQTIIESALIFSGVPGRMQRHVLPNGALAIIDYAHNPSSFENLLSLLRRLTSDLIVIFGAGGERGRDKRPMMGSIAYQYADHVILTTDNPRTENPQEIVEDIRRDIVDSEGKIQVILDRQEAIQYAYTLSKSGSIIAMLGKGPEEYQMIGSQKIFFSEKQIVLSLK